VWLFTQKLYIGEFAGNSSFEIISANPLKTRHYVKTAFPNRRSCAKTSKYVILNLFQDPNTA